MHRQWNLLKTIIGATDWQNELFLTLLDESGEIVSVNSTMQKALHIKNPREEKTNFFSLMHPEHTEIFKEAIETSRSGDTAATAELYLKNGYYHPMKWQVNFLGREQSPASFLCIGYKLLDDERLKQFNALGESNYQLIVEGLSSGVLFQDTKGELIAANKKAADIFDSTLERLYQLKDISSVWDMWTVKQDNGAAIAFNDTPFMKALHTGKQQSAVLNIILRSGERRWISFLSHPLKNNNSHEPYAVVTSLADVSDSYRLKSEMAETNTIFRSFMNRTPNLAWVLDEDGKLLFASNAFYQYFGLTEADSLLKPIEEVVPAAVAKALYAKHMKVLETGRPEEIIEKIKWADGTNFIFHINIFPIDGVSGKKMVGGHAMNMAEKYTVEKQLREANERLLMLSRATSDAIWEWDMQTGYIFRNDALMDMIGYQGDDPRGLSWWLRRIHPDDRNRVTDIIKDATDKGQHSWEDEYRFKCADGSYKHIQDKGYVVYENGLPVKMIGSLQDITEIKKLENQLVEEKLQRQKEITETVIRVQEKERTRIGHELHDNVNQILSTTKMFVEMLTPATDEEKMIKAKSIEYLLSSIEEIRKLSKELVVPQLKEKGLVESIHTLIEDIELSGQLRIRFTHDHETNMVSPGKKITVFRIVQEQMKNILKYSKAKQVDIYLQCKGGDLQLVIKDDGVGFDTAQTHRGIGLSNIHDRTRFYNGVVDIQSSKGKGCILTVNIPLMS